MLRYIVNRILTVLPVIFALSLVTFTITQLPSGMPASRPVGQLREDAPRLSAPEVSRLREYAGRDKPVIARYWEWVSGIVLRADFGYSVTWGRGVSDVIAERVFVTVLVILMTLTSTYLAGVAVAFSCARHRRAARDLPAVFAGSGGPATSTFLLLLMVMFLGSKYRGLAVGGFFSPAFVRARWCPAKAIECVRHLVVPVIVVGTATIAGQMRVLRASILDELDRLSVSGTSAGRVPDARHVRDFPVRACVSPLVRSTTWLLPVLFSASAVVGIVLNLPTAGALLMSSLMARDMRVAGGLLFIMACITVLGSLVADLVLVWLDPGLALSGEEAL